MSGKKIWNAGKENTQVGKKKLGDIPDSDVTTATCINLNVHMNTTIYIYKYKIGKTS